MSAAASRLELEASHDKGIGLSDASAPPKPAGATSEQQEHESLEKLTETTPPESSNPIIAVDMDDVLSETNRDVAECKRYFLGGFGGQTN